MTEAIIVAIITVSGTILSQIIINKRTRTDDEIKTAVRDQKLDDAITGIEKRLDEHNHYAARFAEITETITEIKKDIEYLRKGTNI